MIEPNTIEEEFAKVSSKPSTLDIMSSRTVKPLNESVFDKLVIETYQKINQETYWALWEQHKDQLGYPPKTGYEERRITFQMPNNPFTIIHYKYHIRIDLNPNKYGSYSLLSGQIGNSENWKDLGLTHLSLGATSQMLFNSLFAKSVTVKTAIMAGVPHPSFD